MKNNKNSGWIKIHRKIINWGWYKDINTKIVFIHCLLRANTKDQEFMGYKIPRGSFVTSYGKLSNTLGITLQQVRTALEHLKSTNEITHQTNRHFSIISIVNYEKYQTNNTPINSQVTNKQQTSNKQITTSKEYKNIRIKERERVKREKESLTPTLNDVISFSEKECGIHDRNYCEKFYNFYESTNWTSNSGVKITNWKSKFKYWINKDKKEDEEINWL